MMRVLQERRFYIMEGAGCTPATYWNAWGVLAMAFFPIAIAVGAMIYTGESRSAATTRAMLIPELRFAQLWHSSTSISVASACSR
jgi:hypothetical protein